MCATHTLHAAYLHTAACPWSESEDALQAEVRQWQEKHALLANQKLPHAEAAAAFAQEDATTARLDLKAARDELASLRQELRQANTQREQVCGSSLQRCARGPCLWRRGASACARPRAQHLMARPAAC
jgi:hypothetical protein